MGFFDTLKSRVKKKEAAPSVEFRHMFNLKRIWWISFTSTSLFAIIPICFFALIDYNVTRKSVESEAIMMVSRFTANTWRTISYFLDKQRAAIVFAAQDNSYETLSNPERLAELLGNLRKGFGEYADLGVIDGDGRQIAYVGPYDLQERLYGDEEWFKEVVLRGTYISDVVLGYRKVPHLVIAIRHTLKNGSFFVLRATLEHQFSSMLSSMETDTRKDVFLINKQGIIQTPSRFFGNVFEKIRMPLPPFSNKTNVIDIDNVNGEPMIVAYRYIPDVPFILMVAMPKKKLMAPWYTPRMNLIGYFLGSITLILVWVMGVTTYLVKKLKVADEDRIKNLHMAEYSNKLASIGRLAAGVAHEINNPLAVINEKAGLIKDMFEFKEAYQHDPKLVKAVDAIIASVDRCSRITRRLLGFARHMDVSIQSVNLKELITEVMGFLEKEALYRSIHLTMDIPDDIPPVESDRGKLQQIFLNIVNNAFAALKDGGHLRISMVQRPDSRISIDIEDNGCGISPENLKRIFEPFFSTKTKTGGTGLGLSITYGLIKELGGTIDVKSALGKGTCFTLVFPLSIPREEKTKRETSASNAS
jgi:signal transduction histidine kinase